VNALEKLRDATRILAEIRSAKDAKNLMSMAAAAEYYARKAKLGEEAVAYARTIKIDAMRLLGGYLAVEVRHEGGRPTETVPDGYRLPEGVSKKESAAAQLLHTVAKTAPVLFEEVRIGAKSVTAARREVRKAAVTEAAKLPSDKFRVIYADPPWKYGDQLTEDYGSVKYHYPTMTVAELCALPIIDLVEDNAVLFLWVTTPMLESAFPVIKAWGFSYKSLFVWDKVKHNMGHYNSVRQELLLVAVCGSCTPDVPRLYDSVVSIERTAHSAKPPEFRQMIETLYPHGNRLELFAREKAAGWQAWGNDAAAASAAPVGSQRAG
jgi:N6-adenosine-specific RNA methylase IME4